MARDINRLHHRDESRHLAFGRRLAKELFNRYSSSWTPEILAGVREYLAGYIRATWQEYYNPAVYKDACLSDPYELQREAFEWPASRNRREQISRRWLSSLVKSGILTEAPVA